MKYNASNKPIVCMQTNSTCYKGTSKMAIKGILWHSTGVNNPWLKRYVQPSDDASDREKMLELIGKNAYNNDWNHIKRSAGLNCWIGKLADGTVATVQTMPWDYRPWGCGNGAKGSCNNGWLQFEILEDGLNDKSYFDKVYKEACEITAYLCKLYKLNPKGTQTLNGIEVPVILCHQDSYKLGLGSNHSDVYHWFNRYGKTMDDVRNDVYALMYPPASTTSGKIDTVKEVQNWANKNYKSGLTVDGTYGAKTKKALIKILQTELNQTYGAKLTVDGVWGNKTKAACPTLKKNAKNDVVGVLQALLVCNGYKGAYLDKHYGSTTISAVKSYQKKVGLTVDGIAGKDTFAKLCE